ncbi:MAG: hypothetical protein HEQ40_17730 [Lacibacter sp.]|jgi:hypothetical protein
MKIFIRLGLIFLLFLPFNSAYSQKKDYDMFLFIYDFQEMIHRGYDQSKSSKTETINWILSKFRAYYLKDFKEENKSQDIQRGVYDPVLEGFYVTNYAYSKEVEIIFGFEGDKIIINRTRKVTNHLHRINHKYIHEIIKIPIKDLKELFYPNSMSIHFETYSKSIEINYKHLNQTASTDNFSLDIDLRQEPELKIRIQKAFLHLYSFYKKSTSSEPF